MKTLQVQVYIQQWFHDEHGATIIKFKIFSLTRNYFGHVLVDWWVTSFVKVIW